LRSVFRKTVIGEQELAIGKAGTQRPGTINELLDKLVETIDNTDAKRAMVMYHLSSLSKDKKMPPRRYNTP
jgi:hypothetical protein